MQGGVGVAVNISTMPPPVEVGRLECGLGCGAGTVDSSARASAFLPSATATNGNTPGGAVTTTS